MSRRFAAAQWCWPMPKSTLTDWGALRDQICSVLSSVSRTSSESSSETWITLRGRLFTPRKEVTRGLDVQAFLDRGIVDILSAPDAGQALDTLSWVVAGLNWVLGADALIPPDERAQGIAPRFSPLRALESIVVGIARNRAAIASLENPDSFILDRVARFWQQPEVADLSGAGLRGTVRLQRSVPFGEQWFNPNG